MQKQQWLFIILILSTIFLSGCWSSRELNELAIIMAAGFDKSDDQILLSLQVINPGEISPQKGGSGRVPFVTYRGTGDTVFEAVRKMTQKIPRRSYWSHLRVVVIGEELAKEKGLAHVLDFLARDHEVRGDFYLVLSRNGRAEEVLQVLTPIDKIGAQKMHLSLKTATDAWGSTQTVFISDLIRDLTSPKKGTTLPGIHYIGDLAKGATSSNVQTTDPDTIIEYVGLGVLKEGKLIGWLRQDESIGHNFIQNSITGTIISIPCTQNNKIAVEIFNSKARVDVRLEEQKLKGKIRLNVEGTISETNCTLNLIDLSVVHKLERDVAAAIKRKVEAAIEAGKNLKTDLVGFSEKTYKKYPHYFKQVKEDWDQILLNMDVEVSVDVRLRRTGTEVNPFLNEMEGVK